MIRIKGFDKPQTILASRATVTAGGLTTWIELFSAEDGSGRTSLILGDTNEILTALQVWIKDIKKQTKKEELK